MSYEEILRKLNLFSLERRGPRADLILARVLVALDCLISSSANPELATPTEHCKGQTVFAEEVMSFLRVSLNTLKVYRRA